MCKIVLVSFMVFITNYTIAGLDCDSLAEWSDEIDSSGLRVNQHHIFCGEAGNNGRAKGFHATADGEFPSSYLSSTPVGKANGAGVYTLRNIKLSFDGHEYVKSFSSMYPKNCSVTQINSSIVYSIKHSAGACVDVTWAQCGPNGPKGDMSGHYCQIDGEIYKIATAVLPSDNKKINTGFPIYSP